MTDTIMVDCVGSAVEAMRAITGNAHPVQGYLAQPGQYPYIHWTLSQMRSFPLGHIVTATMPGRPEDAKHARELDVGDKGDATATDVAPWLIARKEFGYNDGQVYCDLTELDPVLAAIHDHGLWDEPWWRIRLAWWWGRPGSPTLDQVMEQIGIYVPAELIPGRGRIWGCQYRNGSVLDWTRVYGVNDFTR